MTGNQINYMGQYEQARHNAAVEAETKRLNDATIAQKQAELAETSRANRASEGIRRTEAKSSRMNARSNRMNAKTNRYSAKTSRKEHKTNVKKRKQDKAYQTRSLQQKDRELDIAAEANRAKMLQAQAGMSKVALDTLVAQWNKKFNEAKTANDARKIRQDWYKFLGSNPLVYMTLRSFGIDPITTESIKFGSTKSKGNKTSATDEHGNVPSLFNKAGHYITLSLKNSKGETKYAQLATDSWDHFVKDYRNANKQTMDYKKFVKSKKVIDKKAKEVFNMFKKYGDILSRTEPG